MKKAIITELKGNYDILACSDLIMHNALLHQINLYVENIMLSISNFEEFKNTMVNLLKNKKSFDFKLERKSCTADCFFTIEEDTLLLNINPSCPLSTNQKKTLDLRCFIKVILDLCANFPIQKMHVTHIQH